MGLLVPVVHPDRVRSPREAAALLRGLGEDEVRVGVVTTDGAQIARLVAAATVGKENEFELDGTLDADGDATLAALVLARPGYLDVSRARVNLRVWGDADWAEPGRLYGPGLDWQGTREEALRRFFELAGTGEIDGRIVGVFEPMRALLSTFLLATGGPVEASIELTLDAAVAIADELSDRPLEWRAGVDISLPSGEITDYLVDSGAAPDEDAWRARIAAALALARGG